MTSGKHHAREERNSLGSRRPLIFHVLPTDVARGAQTYARAMRTKLDGPEVEHRIVTVFRTESASIEADVDLGVPYGLGRRLGFSPIALSRLRRAIRRWQPNVVVAHGGEALKYATFATTGEIKLVYYKIGTSRELLRNPVRRFFHRQLVRRADLVAGVSQEMVDEAVSLLGAPRENTIYIPNGRDPAVFRHRADPTILSPVRFLFVGHMTRTKRPEVFLETIAELTKRGVSVRGVMVGDGPILESLRQSASDRVVFLGARDDVPKLLGDADVLLFTSTTEGEGMPGVLIEAGLAGLPVVATEVPGTRTVVEDGVTGLIIPVDETSRLIDAAETLARDPDLRKKMGLAARQRCLDRFTLDLSVAVWQKQLTRLLVEHSTLNAGFDRGGASRSKVRVAHLTTVDMSLRYLVLPQLQAVVKAGWEATGISAPGPWVDEVKAAGIHHVALHSSTRGMDLGSDLRAAREFWQILHEKQIDVIHTHNPKPGLYGRILGRLAGVPVVVNTVHGLYATPDDTWIKRSVVYILEAIASRFSHAELVQSREDFDFLTRWGISPRRSTHFLGNGVDLTRFNPGRFTEEDRSATRAELGVEEGTVVVGMVGRLVAEKGYPELFEVARRLDGHYQVICIGPGDPDKSDGLPEQVIEQGIQAGVRFLGMRDDVDRLYNAMDLFVLPSHREGFPRAAMEAAAMGLPVIATDIRGCREVVVDGENGLLVPLRDVEALTQAIQRLGSDNDLRARMGEAAVRRARIHFDERRVVDTVIAVYSQLLHQAGKLWSAEGAQNAPLRIARSADSWRIAQLHRSAIDTGFLRRLGTPFLAVLYWALIRSPGATVIVAGDGKPIGFVAGVENTSRFYRNFISRWGLLALIASLPRLLSPSVVRRARETLRYGREAGIPAELLSMAVDPHARGLGLGRRLGEELLTRMHWASVPKVKVVMGAANEAAIALYKSLGFLSHGEVEVHAGDASLEMVWSAPE